MRAQEEGGMPSTVVVIKAILVMRDYLSYLILILMLSCKQSSMNLRYPIKPLDWDSLSAIYLAHKPLKNQIYQDISIARYRSKYLEIWIMP